MQRTNPNISELNGLTINPEFPTNLATFGSPVLVSTGLVATVSGKLLAQLPLPVGATVTNISFAISGAGISGSAAPTIEVSVSTATTAPGTGNVVSGLALTKFANNTAESIALTSYTNYTNMRVVAKGSYLYITTAGNYSLAANSVYTVSAQYFLPI